MGIIESTYTQAVSFLDSLGETQFGTVAAQVATTGQLLAALVVILILIMAGSGRGRLDWGDAIALIVTVVLVAGFMQNWADFNSILNGLYGFFDGLSNSFIAAAIGAPGEATLVGYLDDILSQAASAATSSAGALDILGAVLNGISYILIAGFGALCIIGLVAARAALTILIALAPAAIMCVLSDKTKNYFERWLSALIMFMMFPVIVAGIIGTIIAMLNQAILASTGDDVSTLGAFVPVGTALICGIVMVFVSPIIVSALTGSFEMGRLASRMSGAASAFTGALIGRGATASYSGAKTVTSDTRDFFKDGKGMDNVRAQAQERSNQMNRMYERTRRFGRR